jgi:hypothetical protein
MDRHQRRIQRMGNTVPERLKLLFDRRQSTGLFRFFCPLEASLSGILGYKDLLACIVNHSTPFPTVVTGR